MARLTDLTLRSLQPRGLQYAVFDDALPNFGVRVGTKGTLSFFVMYTVHGRRRRESLGRFPVLSLAEARKFARQRLSRLIIETQSGDVPVAMTFSEAVERFLKLHCEAENKPSTAASTRRLFKCHWLPVFSRRLLQDVGTREITEIIDRHRRKAPYETRHAFAVLRKFFNWAKQQRLVDRSPCDNLALNFRMKPRTRVLNDHELVAVFCAASVLGYPYGPIVQLLMLTGQRRGEIAGLRWSYIDQEKRLITLPADLVKNSREHTFAYGDLAARIFALIPNQGDMLFPARGFDDRPFSGWAKIKAVLDERSGVDFRLHDLRRSWATHVAELDIHPWVIEAHLNHISGMVSGIAAVYNRHKYLNETRVAVARFEEKLSALLERDAQHIAGDHSAHRIGLQPSGARLLTGRAGV
ncbi:MAG: tyrosine-type recombinase/integrase [Hyphomicrobium sp.]